MIHNKMPCSLNISGETLSAWRSRLLSPDELERLGNHIPTCPACQRHLQRFERIAQALRAQHVPSSGNKLWRGVQTAVATSKQQPTPLSQRFLWGSLSAFVLVVVLFAVVFTTLGHNRGSQPTKAATGMPSSTRSPTGRSYTLMQVSMSQSGTDFTARDLKATATCPSGTVLVGGGFTTQLSPKNNQLVFFTANYPSSPNSWTVEVKNPQTGGPITLTTYATCLKSSIMVTTTIVNASANLAGATCPTGTTLLSGGYAMDAILNSLVYSKPVGNSWWAKMGDNTAAGPPHTYALCATAGLAPGKIVTNSTAMTPSGHDAAVVVACDAGQMMTGGGYSFLGPTFTQLWRELRNVDGNNQFSARLYPAFLQTGSRPTPSPGESVQLDAYAVCVVPTHQ